MDPNFFILFLHWFSQQTALKNWITKKIGESSDATIKEVRNYLEIRNKKDLPTLSTSAIRLKDLHYLQEFFDFSESFMKSLEKGSIEKVERSLASSFSHNDPQTLLKTIFSFFLPNRWRKEFLDRFFEHKETLFSFVQDKAPDSELIRNFKRILQDTLLEDRTINKLAEITKNVVAKNHSEEKKPSSIDKHLSSFREYAHLLTFFHPFAVKVRELMECITYVTSSRRFQAQLIANEIAYSQYNKYAEAISSLLKCDPEVRYSIEPKKSQEDSESKE